MNVARASFPGLTNAATSENKFYALRRDRSAGSRARPYAPKIAAPGTPGGVFCRAREALRADFGAFYLSRNKYAFTEYGTKTSA